MANQVEYRDPTPNNFPQDYDPNKVDPRVKLRSESIKHKQKGMDTREAMFQSLEIGATIASEAKTTADKTAESQDNLNQRVDDQIAANTIKDEEIDFRHSNMLQHTFETMGKRGDFYDNSLEETGVNVKWFNPPMDGVNDDSVAIQAAIDFTDKNGYKKVIIPDGNYSMLENIYLKSNLNLVLGHGTVINSKYKWLVLKNGTHDVKVSGGTFRGNFEQKQAFMITLHHAKNCSFENINFEQCLIAEHIFDIDGSNDITIRNCRFAGKLANANRDYIEAIQVDYSSYSSLGYKDENERAACDGVACTNITVKNCRFEPIYDNGVITYPAPMPFGNHYQIEGKNHSNINFIDNYVIDCIQSSGDHGQDLRNAWVHFGDANNLTIRGNRFINTTSSNVSAIRIMPSDMGHKINNIKLDEPVLDYIHVGDLSNIQIINNQFEGFDAAYGNDNQYGLIRADGLKTARNNMVIKQFNVKNNIFKDCYPNGVDASKAEYGIDLIVFNRVSGAISGNSANNIRRLAWTSDSWLTISNNDIVNAYYVPIVSLNRYVIISNNLIRNSYGAIATDVSSFSGGGWNIAKITNNVIIDVLGDLNYSEKYKGASIILSGSGKNDVTNNTIVTGILMPLGIKVRTDVTISEGSAVKISDNIIRGYTQAFNKVQGLVEHNNL